MQIDPKYFNTFLIIVAVIAAGLIAFFTLKNRSLEKTDFKERMFAQDSLQSVFWTHIQKDDSLRITDLKGTYVVVDFWASWSEASLQSHKELTSLKENYPQMLEVIAASVRLRKQNVVSYIEEYNFPFHFVGGSQHFNAFNVPGLPAQLIYNPQGELQNVHLGYQNDSQYDSLRVLISDE